MGHQLKCCILADETLNFGPKKTTLPIFLLDCSNRVWELDGYWMGLCIVSTKNYFFVEARIGNVKKAGGLVGPYVRRK